jgi:hypothetical protein
MAGVPSFVEERVIVFLRWLADVEALDPPPLKWSDLRYVFDIKEDCNDKEAMQA